MRRRLRRKLKPRIQRTFRPQKALLRPDGQQARLHRVRLHRPLSGVQWLRQPQQARQLKEARGGADLANESNRALAKVRWLHRPQQERRPKGAEAEAGPVERFNLVRQARQPVPKVRRPHRPQQEHHLKEGEEGAEPEQLRRESPHHQAQLLLRSRQRLLGAVRVEDRAAREQVRHRPSKPALLQEFRRPLNLRADNEDNFSAALSARAQSNLVARRTSHSRVGREDAGQAKPKVRQLHLRAHMRARVEEGEGRGLVDNRRLHLLLVVLPARRVVENRKGRARNLPERPGENLRLRRPADRAREAERKKASKLLQRPVLNSDLP